jgi:hypothetical protein
MTMMKKILAYLERALPTQQSRQSYKMKIEFSSAGCWRLAAVPADC